MSAVKPTEEQISWAKWWSRDDGWGGREELADRLAEREAAAEQRGREAGIREAAIRCETDAEKAHEDDEATIAFICRENAKRIRSLLVEDVMIRASAAPITGPDLAQKHAFPPLAESGAARVPGVDAGPPDDEETDR